LVPTSRVIGTWRSTQPTASYREVSLPLLQRKNPTKFYVLLNSSQLPRRHIKIFLAMMGLSKRGSLSGLVQPRSLWNFWEVF